MEMNARIEHVQVCSKAVHDGGRFNLARTCALTLDETDENFAYELVQGTDAHRMGYSTKQWPLQSLCVRFY